MSILNENATRLIEGATASCMRRSIQIGDLNIDLTNEQIEEINREADAANHKTNNDE